MRAIHLTLNYNHEKSGRCELCGEESVRTDFAFMGHPRPHERSRRAYRELCRSCHKRLDIAIARILPLDPQTYLIPYIEWAGGEAA